MGPMCVFRFADARTARGPACGRRPRSTGLPLPHARPTSRSQPAGGPRPAPGPLQMTFTSVGAYRLLAGHRPFSRRRGDEHRGKDTSTTTVAAPQRSTGDGQLTVYRIRGMCRKPPPPPSGDGDDHDRMKHGSTATGGHKIRRSTAGRPIRPVWAPGPSERRTAGSSRRRRSPTPPGATCFPTSS